MMEYKKGDVVWIMARFTRLKCFKIHDNNILVAHEVHYKNKEAIVMYEEKCVGIIIDINKDLYGFKGNVYTVRLSSYRFNGKIPVRKIGVEKTWSGVKRIRIIGKLDSREKKKNKKIIKKLEKEKI